MSTIQSSQSEFAARWHVLKFGGTSVASAERWARIESIVRQRTERGLQVAVVCSAVAGVTDLLSQIADTDPAQTEGLVAQLRSRHERLGNEFGLDASKVLAADFKTLESLLAAPRGPARVAQIIGLGEIMSTRLGTLWLHERGLSCVWIDARQLLTADDYGHDGARRFLSATCTPTPCQKTRTGLAEQGQVVITQGFIASSAEGETVLLGRGGSDTSAAYIACLLAAERLEIWTDVPGLFSANPRRISQARLLRRIGYRGAQALGALGACVLHPRAIEAVWDQGIPIELGWTERPDVEGTQINASRDTVGIKAITSRRNLAMFSLRRPPSWQPVGFLADVAACFSKRGLSMDLVSSSCSEIRVTVDLSAFPSAEAQLPEILAELEKSGQARVVHPVASVSIVGKNVSRALFSEESDFGLSEEALLMVVHAANEHHVSVVLDEEAAEMLVTRAHQQLIEEAPSSHDLGPSWAELTTDAESEKGEAA